MYARMKTCLFGLFQQAERHGLPSEIVLVDWNPPTARSLLKDAYRWPRHSQFCNIRVIIVPPSIHQRYEHCNKIPVNFDVAQNVAIRRAKGRFIVAHTIDVMLSDELFRFLAAKKLEEDRLYLIDRYDVKREVARLNSLDEHISYCQRNILRANSYQRGEPIPDLNGLTNFWRGGPGDFTLMARKYWHTLRGYPETNDILGFALDGVLCHMACLAGAKVEILQEPMRLFHIDHGVRRYSREANWLSRAGLRDVLPKRLLARLRSLVRRFIPATNEITNVGLHHISWSELAALISEMVKGRRSYIYNDENWGLGQEHLEEFVVTRNDGSLRI